MHFQKFNNKNINYKILKNAVKKKTFSKFIKLIERKYFERHFKI